MDVSPVRIDIAPAARSTELRLTNTGSDEVSVQVDVRQWSQDLNGADELYDTRALLAVPPLVTIPPGERQIVRIGHLGEPPQEIESTFRVLVTELAPSAGAGTEPGLSMRLRLSIPVFVAPVSVAALPQLALEQAVSTADGTRLTLHNAGSAHARIEHIELRYGGDWTPAPEQLLYRLRYLLPNARATLHVGQGPSRLDGIRIKTADGREWEHAVPPQ